MADGRSRNFAVALAAGTLDGTEIDLAALRRDLGGDEGLQAHLLGRAPTAAEAAPPAATRLAMTLASPGFQRY